MLLCYILSRACRRACPELEVYPEQSRRACPELAEGACSELSRREIGFVSPYFQNFGPFLALEVDITLETIPLLRHDAAPPLNAISRLTTVLTTHKKRLMSSGQPSHGPPQTLARMDGQTGSRVPLSLNQPGDKLCPEPVMVAPAQVLLRAPVRAAVRGEGSRPAFAVLPDDEKTDRCRRLPEHPLLNGR